MLLKIKRVDQCKDVPLPQYMTRGAAGMDLYAAVDKPVTLKPGERSLVPTGIIIELPEGYEAQIRPRSGLANKFGVTLLNSPGTIDWDYRGEIKVIIINLGDDEFVINRCDRIAQMVIHSVETAEIEEIEEIKETERGFGGFGSTGF